MQLEAGCSVKEQPVGQNFMAASGTGSPGPTVLRWENTRRERFAQ